LIDDPFDTRPRGRMTDAQERMLRAYSVSAATGWIVSYPPSLGQSVRAVHEESDSAVVITADGRVVTSDSLG
jgi:hypothetical protein